MLPSNTKRISSVIRSSGAGLPVTQPTQLHEVACLPSVAARSQLQRAVNLANVSNCALNLGSCTTGLGRS